MKTFLISGYITDTKLEFEDVTPAQVKSFLDNLEDGEEVEFQINSFGGSVTAGLSICNLIKEAEKNHKVTCKVLGCAASIASAVACSCETLKMDSTSFLMIHNPWTWTDGDAQKLRHEADVLDQMKESLIDIYQTKFDTFRDQISEMMDFETWIKGSEHEKYGLNIEVAEDGTSEEVVEKTKEETTEEVIEKEETTTEEEVINNRRIPNFRNIPNNLKKSIYTNQHRAEETVTKAECEKRVQGMQSKMAKQINGYTAQIKDLQDQLTDSNEKLTKLNAEVISLQNSLSKATDELKEKTSSLVEKEKTLEMLNSSVNKRTEELPTLSEGLAKCKTPKEKVDFITSGKYIKK
ncbi:MAG: ATP-dependent Clp protease proteolytic subunit [Kiritimatiellae bacterium]|nr:ATP-dependent Clp protease proteolytic subunit [Kiritimatiellia bacterium]